MNGDLAYFREKVLMTLPVLWNPQHGPQNKLTKLYNYGHKISKQFAQADYSNTKAHTHSIKLAIYRDIC